MKYQRAKDILLGAVTASLVIGATTSAFAKVSNMNIPISYNDIKIVVDGKEVKTSSEPFIYNGTTYLPVRAVGEAVGKTVSWDGNTKTVYLGEVPKAETNQNAISNDKNTDVYITGMTISYNYGIPVLYIDYKNTTNEDIVRFDMYINSYDAYGNKLSLYGNKYYIIDKLNKNSSSQGEISLLENGVQTVTVGVYKYQTASGNTVEIPEDKIKWWKKSY